MDDARQTSPLVGSGHSDVTDTRSISAGGIARQPNVHDWWASRANIIMDQEAPLKVKEEMKQLLKLSIPTRLFVELEKGIDVNSADSERVSFAQDLLDLQQLFPLPFMPPAVYDHDMELTKEHDVNNIVLNWISISDAYCEIVRAALEKKVKEWEIRRGVDSLLKKSQRVVPGISVR